MEINIAYGNLLVARSRGNERLSAGTSTVIFITLLRGYETVNPVSVMVAMPFLYNRNTQGEIKVPASRDVPASPRTREFASASTVMPFEVLMNHTV